MERQENQNGILERIKSRQIKAVVVITFFFGDGYIYIFLQSSFSNVGVMFKSNK